MQNSIPSYNKLEKYIAEVDRLDQSFRRKEFFRDIIRLLFKSDGR